MAIPLGETVVEVNGRSYKFSKIAYTGSATTFLVDQTASAVTTVLPTSGAPTASLGSSDANFEKTVTLAAGSAAGEVTVVTTHDGPPSSVKPSSRS
jgi:hypothetical protein